MLDLFMRLALGVAALPEELRGRHGAYLAAAQNDDGGWPGRRGKSDLYYTAFGLGGLALLGQLTDPAARRAAAFVRPLAAAAGSALSCIDCLSLVAAAALIETAVGEDVFAQAGRDRRQAVSELVALFARPDGGYAKSVRSGPSSTYHTFLVVLCRQLIGMPLDDVEPLCALIRARRRDDGGFVELPPLRNSGTSPTAAAAGLLQLVDRLAPSLAAGAAQFLAGMQTAQGGLRANTQVPVPDLLSTFTGLVALTVLDRTDAIHTLATAGFARGLELPGGGFRAGTWDHATDVEYTVYGLGVLAMGS